MTWLLLIPVVGLNFLLWGLVGGVRFLDDLRLPRPWRHGSRGRRHSAAGASGSATSRTAASIALSQVAVVMAAHNEELVIGRSLEALAQLVPRTCIHVVSDASTDDTVAIVRGAGIHVVETPTNVGKAGALTYGIDHFALTTRYAAVLVLDADTQLDPAYFDVALPCFDHPEVAVVAGCAHTRWQRGLGLVGHVLVAHRQRIYLLTQLLIKYGQTWRGLSATHIVPGFASIYRSGVLDQLDINPPGLVIEDFNMTFELNGRALGRVAFEPRAKAYTQDPAQLRDYVKQTQRWSLGLWQTVRKHWPGRPIFTWSLGLMLAEVVVSSLFFLALPVAVVLLLLAHWVPVALTVPVLGPVTAAVAGHFSLWGLLLLVVLPDYLLTCVTAVAERRPSYLWLGLLFLPLRVLDSWVALSSAPRAWRVRSTGSWVSPSRRAEPGIPGTVALTAQPALAASALRATSRTSSRATSRTTHLATQDAS